MQWLERATRQHRRALQLWTAIVRQVLGWKPRVRRSIKKGSWRYKEWQTRQFCLAFNSGSQAALVDHLDIQRPKLCKRQAIVRSWQAFVQTLLAFPRP